MPATSGTDLLFGTAGNNTINALAGADIVFGRGGNDMLFGGDGADVLFGGSGADKLFGDAGVDILNGDAGNDTLEGGSGNDILIDTFGNDSLSGGLGDDMLNGGVGKDTLAGGDGNDGLDGSLGGDTLNGGNGNDVVDGGNGLELDLCRGDADDDILIFDIGDATAAGSHQGGAGIDTFLIRDDFSNGMTMVDFTMLPDNRITGIERIALDGDPSSQTIKLGIADVLALSDTTDTLIVTANGDDPMTMGSERDVVDLEGFTVGATMGGFTTYTGGEATVMVDTDALVA